MESNKYYNYDFILEDAKNKFRNFGKEHEGFPDAVKYFCEILAEFIPNEVSVRDLGDIVSLFTTLIDVSCDPNPIVEINEFGKDAEEIVNKFMHMDVYKKFVESDKLPYNCSYEDFMSNVINRIADSEFADNFLDYYARLTHYNENLRERGHAILPIKNAVDWLIENIGESKTADEPVDFLRNLSERRALTPEEEMTFRESIYEQISYPVICGQKVVLDIDYRPCQIIKTAGDKIGLDDMLDYPIKTQIEIANDYARVTSGRKTTTLFAIDQKVYDNINDILYYNKTYQKMK